MRLPWLLVNGVLVLLALLAVLAAHFLREMRRLRSRLETASQELQRLQLTFSRFAPSEVVDRIAASGITATGEKKEVTVLFADLVEFSAMSENADPAIVVRVLNGYFARMSRAVADHGGHVSKFIGDGILALFGALQPNPWQANDAVHAALAMQQALHEYNRELAADKLPTLRLGIGVHRGVVVAGIVGSDELMEFTVIGRHVNLAARVEQLTRRHRADILVTAQVKDTLDPRFVFRQLPAAEVRGLSEPVVTFAVEGFRSDAAAPPDRPMGTR